MPNEGVQFNAATVTVPFKPDMAEFDRAIDAAEQRITEIPGKFKDALSDVAKDFGERLDGWKTQIDAIGERLDSSAAAGGNRQESEQRGVQDGETERLLRDISDGMRDINTALGTIVGLLTTMQNN